MGIEERAAALYNDNENEEVLALAEKNWPPLGQALPEGMSEVCRHAFIASRRANPDGVTQDLWFARALVAAVLTDSVETAAGLLLPSFFSAIERGKDGALGGFATARLILEEFRRLLPEDHPAWSRLFDRIYHEKLAACLILSGELADAEHEYVLALGFAQENQDWRGQLKCRGGIALTRYLQTVVGPSAQTIGDANLEETMTVLAEALNAGYSDVAGWATTNISVMKRGDLEGWTPYEVL